MGKEPHLGGGLAVILLASLRDLGPVLRKQARRAMRRPDDCNMSGPMCVGALENYYHQVSTIGQRLCILGIPNRPPALLFAVR
jgi:hypothetical protein